MKKLKGLSVVLPVFNEESNVGEVIEACLATLPQYAERVEVIAVNDGSRDGTAAVLDRFASQPEVRVITHPLNRGYGAALRSGFQAASQPYVFFMDSDRQFDVREFGRLAERVEEADIVVGFRVKRSDPWPRVVAGWGFTAVNRWVLGLRIRDLNCAFKLFRAEVVKDLPLESDGAFINAELLGRAVRRGRRIVEVGVTHYPRPSGRQTGLHPLVVLRAFAELFRLAWRIRFSARQVQ